MSIPQSNTSGTGATYGETAQISAALPDQRAGPRHLIPSSLPKLNRWFNRFLRQNQKFFILARAGCQIGLPRPARRATIRALFDFDNRLASESLQAFRPLSLV